MQELEEFDSSDFDPGESRGGRVGLRR